MNENTAKLRTTAGEAQKDVKTTVTDGTLFSSDAARPNNNIIVLACSGRGKPRSAVIPDIFSAFSRSSETK